MMFKPLSLQTGWAVNSAIITLQLWFKLSARLSLTYISVSINGGTLCDCCPSCRAFGAVTRVLMRTCKSTVVLELLFLSHTRSFTIESLFFFSYNLLTALLTDTKSRKCLAVTRNRTDSIYSAVSNNKDQTFLVILCTILKNQHCTDFK